MKISKVYQGIGILLALTGCASNHHLVFFTNTTIGVEISSEPNTGSPVKFLIGYKRQEGVIDPLIPDYEFHPNEKDTSGTTTLSEPTNGDTNIIMVRGGTAIPKGSTTKAHSVLAKMNFGATGGGADTTTAQFFATGPAAVELAKSEGITGALSGEPKNNPPHKINLVGNNNNDTAAVYSHIKSIYDILIESTTTGEKHSQKSLEIKAKVDSIDSGFFKVQFTQYSWFDAAKIKINKNLYNVHAANHSFVNVIAYINNALISSKLAEEAVINSATTDTTGAVLTLVERKDMLEKSKESMVRHNKGRDLLSSNEAVLEMLEHVYKKVILEEK